MSESNQTIYAKTTYVTDDPTGHDERGRGKGRFKRRSCRFCKSKGPVEEQIDYKRVDILVQFVSNKGKILPRRLTGTCAKHQRLVAKAIKRSRMAGLMPFSVK